MTVAPPTRDTEGQKWASEPVYGSVASYTNERTYTVPFEEVAELFSQPHYGGSESRVWSDNSLDAPPGSTLQAEADAIAAEMKEEEHWRQRAHHLHTCTGGQSGRACFTCGKVA